MSRIPATLIVLVVLGASRAAGQSDEPNDAVEPATRRPAGRRLLDEAAHERQAGRAAPAAEDPLLAPVPNPMRPLERLPDAEPAAPPAAAAPAANYPFDVPTRGPAPAVQDRYRGAPERSVSAAARPDSHPASDLPAEALDEASPGVDSAPAARAYPPSEPGAPLRAPQAPVQLVSHEEPAAPVTAEAPANLPPEKAPSELAAAAEAAVLPTPPLGSESAPPLAPRGEAGAVGDGQRGGQKGGPFGDARSPMMTMVGSLALVLSLFFAVAWVLRRATPASLRSMPLDVVEVLGRAPLPGKQQQMHLVRCGRKLLLLASSPTGFTTLTEVTDDEEVERLVSLCRGESPRGSATTFSQSVAAGGHEPFGRGYGEESLDSAAAALARRLSRSSRMGSEHA